MAEDVGTVLGGAAQGAAAGASVGGAVGAVIGGVLGFIGGIFGSKAKRYAKRATQEERVAALRGQAAQRRQLVRDLYVARATAVAASSSESGGLTSSAPLGAISSVGAQGRAALNYFDAQSQSMANVNYWNDKAKKAAGNAAAIGSLLNLAGDIKGVYDSTWGATSNMVKSVSSDRTGSPGSYDSLIPSTNFSFGS